MTRGFEAWQDALIWHSCVDKARSIEEITLAWGFKSKTSLYRSGAINRLLKKGFISVDRIEGKSNYYYSEFEPVLMEYTDIGRETNSVHQKFIPNWIKVLSDIRIRQLFFSFEKILVFFRKKPSGFINNSDKWSKFLLFVRHLIAFMQKIAEMSKGKPQNQNFRAIAEFFSQKMLESPDYDSGEYCKTVLNEIRYEQLASLLEEIKDTPEKTAVSDMVKVIGNLTIAVAPAKTK